jgi:hypothetical protein
MLYFLLETFTVFIWKLYIVSAFPVSFTGFSAYGNLETYSNEYLLIYAKKKMS